jgi:hypothetical protein
MSRHDDIFRSGDLIIDGLPVVYFLLYRTGDMISSRWGISLGSWDLSSAHPALRRQPFSRQLHDWPAINFLSTAMRGFVLISNHRVFSSAYLPIEFFFCSRTVRHRELRTALAPCLPCFVSTTTIHHHPPPRRPSSILK